MPVSFLPCRLIAACLFAAALSLPSSALAEQQDELAPGFNACLKRAEENVADKDSYEYRSAQLKCYQDAGEYWQNMFISEYKKATRNGDYYSGDFSDEEDPCDGPGPKYDLQQFRLAWEQYFWAAAKLVYNGDAPAMTWIFQEFRANEYKKLVHMMRELGIFKQPGENTQNGQTNSITN